MKLLSMKSVWAEMALFLILCAAMMIDTDGAHAAPISQFETSFKEIQLQSIASQEKSDSIDCINNIGVATDNYGRQHFWLDENQLCFSHDSESSVILLSVPDRLSESKEISMKIEYNLQNGQTLVRTYQAEVSGGSSLILSNEQDVAEFLTLANRTSFVRATYQVDQSFTRVLVFSLVGGRFS